MKKKFIYYVLLVAIIFSCNSNEEAIVQIPLQEKTVLNQNYDNNSQQVFDLYLPANRSEAATKTIILVHGGGWVGGDKTDMAYMIPFLKQNLPDYAIANVNYRLASAGNYAFPMQIDDIKAIVTKLKNDDNGISDNIGFIGTSAGAHLSMLYSYTNNNSNNIKMVASIVGPTNFRDTNYTSNPAWTANYLALTGVDYATNPGYFEQISPFYTARATSSPTILLYGNTDPLIPNSQGIDMHAKLDQLGVYNEFKVYNGGHGNWSQVDILDAFARILNFVKLKF